MQSSFEFYSTFRLNVIGRPPNRFYETAAFVIVSYQFQSVVPDLPSPADYLPLLTQMHDRHWYSNFGPLSQALEGRLSAIFGNADETCVAVCNATSGLSASLVATGRSGPVLVPAFTFPASLGAVLAAGMSPIVADVDCDSWAFGRDQLDRALDATGATIVMLVAPFGLKCNFEPEIALCRERNVAVVIDNAAGLGVPRSAIGLTADVFEVFSMHATKPLGIGEGGVIFAHRDRDKSLRAAVNFALSSYTSPSGPRWGFNGKMSEFHAAVGLAQIARFETIIGTRQKFAAGYIARLSKHSSLIFPNNSSISSWQFFPVLLPSRGLVDRFVSDAAAVGIEIRRYYRPSLSRWPEIKVWSACNIAEDLADRMCVLPVRSNQPSEEAETLLDLTSGTLSGVL